MHCPLSREERRLRSIKRENSALFFVKRREETEVNKRENNALFFVKGGEETEVKKESK